ncbi:MAG TPA: hypothetical protein VFH75_00010 [Actinomycetota bacterium]|nr:hypothetical protein [Actinomycetota bacterium]
MKGFLAHIESWEDAVDSVQSDLLFEFRNELPPDLIAEVARQSVEDLRREPVRIKTFVPLLALRRARDRLRLSSSASGASRFARS